MISHSDSPQPDRTNRRRSRRISYHPSYRQRRNPSTTSPELNQPDPYTQLQQKQQFELYLFGLFLEEVKKTGRCDYPALNRHLESTYEQSLSTSPQRFFFKPPSEVSNIEESTFVTDLSVRTADDQIKDQTNISLQQKIRGRTDAKHGQHSDPSLNYVSIQDPKIQPCLSTSQTVSKSTLNLNEKSELIESTPLIADSSTPAENTISQKQRPSVQPSSFLEGSPLTNSKPIAQQEQNGIYGEQFSTNQPPATQYRKPDSGTSVLLQTLVRDLPVFRQLASQQSQIGQQLSNLGDQTRQHPMMKRLCDCLSLIHLYSNEISELIGNIPHQDDA